MSKNNENNNDELNIPMGQRLLNQPFTLLIIGIVVMLVFYTGWGLWEILSLPESQLP